VDEWGVWYRPGEEIGPKYQLSQPLTLRDAVHTAVTLDVFNRHADKIEMANVAQTINCIHSLMLAEGDRYARTPPYYVFEMYRNHMRSRLASMEIRCDELKVPSRNGAATMPGLSGSASTKDGMLHVTITNPSLDSSITTNLRLTSGSITEGRGMVLTNADMAARNTLDKPNEVQLSGLPITVRNSRVEVSIPPRAVVLLELKMT
jgi:alpha-L-arabinofuranosidase